MHHRTPIAVAILLAVIVVACSGASSASGPTGQTLDGRTFLSTTVDGQALVAGTRMRITFRTGTVSVNAGCNAFGGPYRINGNDLVVGQIVTTDMGCAADRMAQDQWIAALLGGAAFSLDGNTLTLTRGGIRVTLLDRVVADPDQPLIGTHWVVDGLMSGGTASSVPTGTNATLVFSNSNVVVATGCNGGTATATVTGASITFGDLVLTRQACLGDAVALQDAMVAVLRGTVSYSIQAGSLTIQAGAIGLLLHAAQ